MTLLSLAPGRSQLQDHLLAGSTATVAGLVNVCSVMAFFSFASNITGHVAVFAEELVSGHLHQVSVVAAWFALFVLGAGISGHCVHRAERPSASPSWISVPLALECILLAAVGFYGATSYRETLRETEYLAGVLLLAMGLQNGLVASVSKGLVKTTHLTGLLTDLGIELVAMTDVARRLDPTLRFKLVLHSLTFATYVMGGILGGLLFRALRFEAFYVGSAVLLAILLHDRVARRLPRAERLPSSFARQARAASASRTAWTTNSGSDVRA